MSRTYKDKPSKLKHEAWDKDMDYVEGTWYRLELPTTKPKKRKKSMIFLYIPFKGGYIPFERPYIAL